MKVGDLVLRSDEEGREELGVGIIIEVEEHDWVVPSKDHPGIREQSLIVMYSQHGLSWDMEDGLEGVG